MIENVKTVSVCVVALNEAKYLPLLLENIMSQTYPHCYTEVVLIDSGSNDCTKQIMLDFKKQANDFKNVIIFDNYKKHLAAGWNIAIESYTSDVIIRVDAHAIIPEDFVEKNMKVLNSGEYVSGGARPCIIVNKTAVGRLLLLAENSMFGSSINRRNDDKKKQYVNTMFHAAYRRKVFEDSGSFNEYLGRTEDNEMNYRIRQAGYKLCFDPDIISYQQTRPTLKKMLRQKYLNGYWIGLTSGVCPKCLSVFHFVPFAFVLAIIMTTITAFAGYPILSYLLWSCYFFAAIAMALIAVAHDKDSSNFLKIIPLTLLFFTLHMCYGCGTVVGLFEMPFWRKKIPQEHCILKKGA